MSSVPNRLYSAAEYLAKDRAADYRSEFIKGYIVAMPGGTERHAMICDNLVERTRTRLRGTPCHPYSSSLRVKIEPTGNYTYPDLSIVCGERRFDDSLRDTLINPRLIVEVLSPSTEQHDRGWKLRSYQLIPSLEEYVLVSQDEPRIERFLRQGEIGWLMTAVSGLDQTVRFESVNCDLPLTEIYEGVVFGPAPE
jgi:Uma2 family endonuclease